MLFVLQMQLPLLIKFNPWLLVSVKFHCKFSSSVYVSMNRIVAYRDYCNHSVQWKLVTAIDINKSIENLHSILTVYYFVSGLKKISRQNDVRGIYG